MWSATLSPLQHLCSDGSLGIGRGARTEGQEGRGRLSSFGVGFLYLLSYKLTLKGSDVERKWAGGHPEEGEQVLGMVVVRAEGERGPF